MEESDLLSKLEELILEENKIVTLKAFSKCCELSISKSRRILKNFLETHESQLTACYTVYGYRTIDDIRTIGYTVAKGEDLNKTKALFNETPCVELYSVNKGPLKSLDDVYSSDEAFLDEFKCSSIRPKIICNQQLPNLRELFPIKVPEVATSEVDNKSSFSKSFQAKTKKANTGLAAAFAKTKKIDETANNASQKEDIKIDEPKKTVPNKLNNQNKAKGGAMMAFVQKGVNNTKSVSQPVKKESPKEAIKNETPPEDVKKLEKQIWSDSSEEEEEELEKPIPKKKVESSKKPAKKMRRIVTFSSSDSEAESEVLTTNNSETKSGKKQSQKTLTESNVDNNKQEKAKVTEKSNVKTKPKKEKPAEEVKPKRNAKRKRKMSRESSDNEDPLPKENNSNKNADSGSSDYNDMIPPTPIQMQKKGPCMQYKTVSKTFQDEDGFFVTKKEKCFVEVQEPEDPKEVPNLQPKPAQSSAKGKKKQENVAKSKQASISSFFTKKS